MTLFNPFDLDLHLFETIDIAFDSDDDLPEEVMEFYREYNASSVDDIIVAWQMGWHNEQFINNKVTMRFYLAKK